jgi:hypothetical protein
MTGQILTLAVTAGVKTLKCFSAYFDAQLWVMSIVWELSTHIVSAQACVSVPPQERIVSMLRWAWRQ